MTEESVHHKEGNVSAGSTEDEEIIELTDEIAATPSNDEEIIELTDEVAATSPNDDEIIELTDEVVKTDTTGPADAGDRADKQEPEASAVPEMIAEAENTSASETIAEAFPDGGIKIGDDIDEESYFDEGEQDDFVNSLGMDLETDSAISQLPEENEPAPSEIVPSLTEAISSEQIEAAIERVIMKILPEKIDSILSAAIEKTLVREIDKIKELLLEDSSGDNV